MPTKTLFFLSFSLLLFLPSLPLLFFAPYIAALAYRNELIVVLWKSLGISLLIALFSTSMPFGLIPLSYCAASLLLFFHTRYFFADKWFTLPLMTYLFSLYGSFFYFLLFPLFDQPFCLTPSLLLTEILIAPLWDTLLAGIVVLVMYRKKKATT